MPLQEVEDVEEEEDSMAAAEPSMVAQAECVVADKDFEAAPGSSAGAKDSDAATDLAGVCMETR
jgi:hypothetical protein